MLSTYYSVEELANKKGVSMAQISIAWMLSKDGVSAPIVGSTNLKNLEDIIGMFRVASLPGLSEVLTAGRYVGALGVKLTPDEVKFLEEPYKPVPIAGHF